MMLYLFLSGVLLTHLRRPVSRMTVSEQQLEGEFRYVNSRLITNAEEVAFYRGNAREKRTMLTAFTRLVSERFSLLYFVIYSSTFHILFSKFYRLIICAVSWNSASRWASLTTLSLNVCHI